MENNNINNSVNNNVGVNTGSGNVSTSAVNNTISQQPVNQTTTVNTAPTNSIPVNPNVVNYASSQAVVNQPTASGNNIVNGEQQKSYKKLYIWMGVIVGLVLIIAIVLLVFLLNGSIENRNRLTCNKTTQEEGYTYNIKRYYTFQDDIMMRVYFTYTFEYQDELTDDKYNKYFDEIINNETHGSTKYGLATNIKKEGNKVIITSYEPSYWNETFKQVKNINKDEGYTCE